MPDFTKNEHFLPPDTHTYVCVSGSKKCSFFRKIWHAMFSWNIRFEICPFLLLPKITNIFCQMNRAALRPLPNYFMFSLLTCLYCCWPVSIIALIKSSEVGWVDLIVSRNSFWWDWKYMFRNCTFALLISKSCNKISSFQLKPFS